eukprot:TRINITY_DN3029_c0_g1_i6.p1 TRINITY_DN3029_c0_g1~~TRINITY_DN3029_c0_g1_i6.p1  ORF type:complete len:142 (+),score=10.87 TRINITY_DN3029_c0_g1_i6:31-426(+)
MPMMGAQMAQPMPTYSAPIAAPAPNFASAPAQYYTSPAPVWTMQTAAASCPNCGNVYLDDSIFCRMCGTQRVGWAHGHVQPAGRERRWPAFATGVCSLHGSRIATGPPPVMSRSVDHCKHHALVCSALHAF